jgi:peptide/nickel transport system permease protein
VRRGARFLKHWQNLLGLGLVATFIFLAVAAPWLAPVRDRKEVYESFRLVPGLKGGLPFSPRPGAPLGTVAVGVGGRQLDVFYTLVWGSRSALRFGLTAACFTAIIGTLVGAISGFAGGWVKGLMMRTTDAFLAFPIIAGVVFFLQLLNLSEAYSTTQGIALSGPAPPVNPLVALFEWIDPVLLALILFSWMPYARLTYVQVLNIRQAEFVQASRTLGAGPGRIIFRHLIPNSIAPTIVMAASQVGGMVLLQATLTFIGIPAGSEWGEMLAIGRRWIIGPLNNPLGYWWVFLPITSALVLFGIGWNLLGDGLNDWLNPRLS